MPRRRIWTEKERSLTSNSLLLYIPSMFVNFRGLGLEMVVRWVIAWVTLSNVSFEIHGLCRYRESNDEKLTTIPDFRPCLSMYNATLTKLLNGTISNTTAILDFDTLMKRSQRQESYEAAVQQPLFTTIYYSLWTCLVGSIILWIFVGLSGRAVYWELKCCQSCSCCDCRQRQFWLKHWCPLVFYVCVFHLYSIPQNRQRGGIGSTIPFWTALAYLTK